MTHSEIKKVADNLFNAAKNAAKSINELAIALNKLHCNKTKNHYRKPSKY